MLNSPVGLGVLKIDFDLGVRNYFLKLYMSNTWMGFPGVLVHKESTCDTGDARTQVQSLGWGDTLKEGMEPTPVFLPGESPWTEEPDGLQSMGLQIVGHIWSSWACTHAIHEYILVVKESMIHEYTEEIEISHDHRLNLDAGYSVTHSVVSDSVISWTVALQATLSTELSMGFSRWEYWSAQPFPSPEDHADPGIEPESPALQADSF